MFESDINFIKIVNTLWNYLRKSSIIFYIVAFGTLFTRYSSYAILAVVLGTLVLFYRELIIFLKVLPRDFAFIGFGLKMLIGTKLLQKRKITLVKAFQKRVKMHPNKTAFIHDEKIWTFQQVDEYSNQIANYLKSQGIKEGATVALFMENKPEYVCIWLGIIKLRAVCSLINTNQRHEALLHSLTIVNATSLIYSSELSEAIFEIKEQLKGIRKYAYDCNENKEEIADCNISEEVKYASAKPPREIAVATVHDRILYIYTSGTTGFPKAAVITNLRSIYMVYSMKFGFNIHENDILYTTLPMYHSAGGILGSGQCLVGGTTQVIRTKFSARNFWTDCVKYNCTIAQYIGEMCRYLLLAPKVPEENQHHLRLMFGNGLRSQLWDEFVTRFKIPQIGEMYGSTEGNANMLNAWNKRGAVGYIPFFAAIVYPVNLIRIDLETGEPIRDKNGVCIKCESGEPGLLVGKIVQNQAISAYEGYHDEKASSKKILHDVFSKGDIAFNTGDILVKDEMNYYYFKDRTGDTYRWKGENVATLEVEAIISNIIHHKDVTAYGVQIPNTEGRAGMIAIVDENNNTDLDHLAQETKKYLPSYALPIFVRIVKHVNMTGTFKLMKVQLQSDGFNPNTIKDPIYYLDVAESKYVRLTREMYDKIINKEINL